MDDATTCTEEARSPDGTTSGSSARNRRVGRLSRVLATLADDDARDVPF